MQEHQKKQSMGVLTLAALGVVYGDIGTSPLYTIKECFGHSYGLEVTRENVLGILSLVFWMINLVVSLKYILFITRADNKGEGGMLSLMALAQRNLDPKTKRAGIVMMMGVFGAALFYGDGMITPAISVLSAVEGLEVVTPGLKHYVLPITLAILAVLFLIQKQGTAKVGSLFGPIVCVWFLTLGLLGVSWIVREPGVLAAVNPWYGIQFFLAHKQEAFLALGAVVLAVTGAEALYADMGHFGRRPLQLAWYGAVLPSLVLNYFGQGALLLQNPAAKANPFFMMAPQWGTLALVVLATAATVIASQAVISGAFSLTRQAVQLGLFPRLAILHTSAREMGQIYIPAVNWGLFVTVVILVLSFKSSGNLAAAYGVTVVAMMVLTSLLAFLVAPIIWKKRWQWGALFLVLFLGIDLLLLGSNALKVPDGGWFPLMVGVVVFFVLTTWKRGRSVLSGRLAEGMLPQELFVESIAHSETPRVSGTAVFMTSDPVGVPHALMHNLKHNKILHEQVVFLTVKNETVPYVAESDRIEFVELGHDFYRIVVRYGYMESPDVPEALTHCQGRSGLDFELMNTSFFLSRESVVRAAKPGLGFWRHRLFVRMSRNAMQATDFFNIPSNRVVELGLQVAL